MIKGAIFDMDGTLLDSMNVWATTGQEYLCRRGITPAHGKKDCLMFQGWDGIVAHFRDAYGIEEAPETVVADILKLVKQNYDATATPLPDAIAFLETLKRNGVKITLATATDRSVVEPTLRRLGMWDLFDGVFTCSELKTSKLSPLIYDTARAFMGTPLENTWVFEDALYAAKTAKAAGYALCGICDRFEPRGEELKRIADVYLDGYAEAAKLPFWEKLT
ncbi:MAG: HAD family phosphatase [Clostridia bacterium]|nr:HAD family phosphatase [Clostridia bacterium]